MRTRTRARTGSQLAVHRACLALETGEFKAVLIAGAETAASAARADKDYPAGGSKMAELDSWSDEQAKYAGPTH